MSSGNLKDIALAYLASGLAVLPARLKSKRPAVPTWEQYRGRLPSHTEIEAWFANHQDALCIVAGVISGNTEMLDFDCAGAAFDAWCKRIQQAAPGLLERLAIESTPSGGWHVIYRCLCEICGNTVLARRKVSVPSGEPAVLYGKTYKPTRDAHGGWYVSGHGRSRPDGVQGSRNSCDRSRARRCWTKQNAKLEMQPKEAVSGSSTLAA